MSPQTRQVLAACKDAALLWGLLVLLIPATIAAAYSSFDPPTKTAINLLVAAIQVAIIGIFFMNLSRSTWLLRLAAAAGLYWLVIFFTLTLNDYESRPASSPCDGPAFVGADLSQCPSPVR